MTKQVATDQIRYYCKQIGLLTPQPQPRKAYLYIFTCPHLYLQWEAQIKYLNKQFQQFGTAVGVIEFNDRSNNTKGYHLHVISSELIDTTLPPQEINSLDSIIEYLSKEWGSNRYKYISDLKFKSKEKNNNKKRVSVEVNVQPIYKKKSNIFIRKKVTYLFKSKEKNNNKKRVSVEVNVQLCYFDDT